MKYHEAIVNHLLALKDGHIPEALPLGNDDAFAQIIQAVNAVTETLAQKKQKELMDKSRLNELQEVLFAYLARDFSKKAKVVGDRQEIDALALCINYFGEELAYNFRQLIESERNLREAQSLARIGSWHWDWVNEALYWSDEMKIIFEAEGVDNELLTDYYWSLLPEEDEQKLSYLVQRTMAYGESYQLEHKIKCRDGKIKHLFCIGEAVLDASGKVIGIKGVAQDITDRNTIAQLQASEVLLKQQQEALLHLNAQLQTSEEELKTQQEELLEANAVLASNVKALQQARTALNLKAKELEVASNYKSEFLANMSHELRTPLNSIMILSKLLQDNKDKNLTPRQVEFASVIQKSGADLLKLINDVLDLAKVEAGKVEIEIETHEIETLVESLSMTFEPISYERGITFQVEMRHDLPKYIKTDAVKLAQILKNLLSNAFKFTSSGGCVTLSLKKCKPLAHFKQQALIESTEVLEIAIKDTGIGIPKEKQELVFLAFHQGDGTTQRKYGGTGLGLSISKELANLLGGEIHLESEVGKGTTFSMYLPFQAPPAQDKLNPLENTSFFAEEQHFHRHWQDKNKPLQMEIPDDREIFHDTQKSLLIVEDDLAFAKMLLDFAHERSFKAIVVTRGDLVLQYVEMYQPQAIILDIQLPVIDGWNVLQRLKLSDYAHIPIHIISGTDRRKIGLSLGAISYLVKPVNTEDLEQVFSEISQVNKFKFSPHNYYLRNMQSNELSNALAGKVILIADDDDRNVFALQTILEQEDIHCLVAVNGIEAVRMVKQRSDIDIVLMDIMMPEMDGYEATKHIRAAGKSSLPIIGLTAKAMKGDREKCLEAGLSDYLSKPINVDQLFSLLFNWLQRA